MTAIGEKNGDRGGPDRCPPARGKSRPPKPPEALTRYRNLAAPAAEDNHIVFGSRRRRQSKFHLYSASVCGGSLTDIDLAFSFPSAKKAERNGRSATRNG